MSLLSFWAYQYGLTLQLYVLNTSMYFPIVFKPLNQIIQYSASIIFHVKVAEYFSNIS